MMLIGLVLTVTVAFTMGSFGHLVVLVVLTACAALGVFFLFGLLSGHVRVGESLDAGAVLGLLSRSVDAGVLITDRNGDPVFASNEMARLVGRTLSGSALTGMGLREASLEIPVTTSRQLFRMARSAERGEQLEERLEFTVKGAARWLRVSARPETATRIEGRFESATGPLIVWHVLDVTDEQAQFDAIVAGLSAMLALYDEAPVGLVSVSGAGVITHVNAVFARWLGMAPDAFAGGAVKLDDILPKDGRFDLLSARAAHPLPAGVDLDITRTDGGVVSLRLLPHAVSEGPDAGLIIAAFHPQESGLAPRDESLTEVRFARFFRSAPFGMATVSPEGRIVSANAAFSRMVLGGESGTGEDAFDVLSEAADPETRAAVDAGLKQVLAGRSKVSPLDMTRGGRERAWRLHMAPTVTTSRSREAAILYTIDSSEQKTLEAKLEQSQKMDAVGKLAGGIAHDFNNVLTVIIGYSDMLLQKRRPSDPAYQEIMNIKSSANRAASLVGKLLAFSRQQTLQIETLQLGEVITDLAPLLKRSIGEKIELDMIPGRDLWTVRADKTQLEHVIINLVVNARDAMPDGGRITITLRNFPERESARLARVDMRGRDYILIEVEDTGTGMPPEIVAKIFDPFFTTKAVGKGTGLGLATAYGFIEQTGGFILPESTVGQGSVFRIYLPRHFAETDEEGVAPPAKPAKTEHLLDLTGTGRVLVVEDEDMVRGVVVLALKSRGYEVLEASTGREALEVMEENEGRIHLVVSDVVMPEMDGPTLLKELRKKNPYLKIIFVSGYPNEAFRSSLDEDEPFAFLAKPFSLPDLAAKVKEELLR